MNKSHEIKNDLMGRVVCERMIELERVLVIINSVFSLHFHKSSLDITADSHS